ncbi:MAG: hypothetical protein ACXIUM_00445 [Wenzhouxiangella sp.]
MLQKLAKAWARYLTRSPSSRSPMFAVLFFVIGVTFISLHFFGVLSHVVLLASGIMFVLHGVQIFERCGFSLLLDEFMPKQPGPRGDSNS